MTPEMRTKLARLSLVVTDFDGVLTDGSVYVDQDGRESVRCSRHDGRAVERWREAGIPTVILSRETNPVVTARARKMGVDAVVQGVRDKGAAMRDLRARLDEAGVEHVVLYVGDSEDDLGAMAEAHLVACPCDARPEVVRYVREREAAGTGRVVPVQGGAGVLAWLCDRWREAREEEGKQMTLTNELSGRYGKVVTAIDVGDGGPVIEFEDGERITLTKETPEGWPDTPPARYTIEGNKGDLVGHALRHAGTWNRDIREEGESVYSTTCFAFSSDAGTVCVCMHLQGDVVRGGVLK